MKKKLVSFICTNNKFAEKKYQGKYSGHNSFKTYLGINITKEFLLNRITVRAILTEVS